MGNKMARIGVGILLVSTVISVAAPVIAPYDPNHTQLSSRLSQPEWVTYFPDGYRLSKNLVLVNDPGFNEPSSVQAWTVTGSPSAISDLQVSYAPGVFTIGAQGYPSKGSLQMVYTGSSPGGVNLTSTFHYPYHGPPGKFLATISYLASGATKTQPIGLKIFVDRGDDQFVLYDQNITSSNQWNSLALDSDSQLIQTTLKTSTTNLNPAQIIFSSLQNYTFAVQVTFTGPQSLNIDNLQLQLYGTAFGLFGTDDQGSDIFSWVVWGSRVSLFVGYIAAFLGIGIGLLVGLMAGFLGRLVDETLMRFTDMMLVIPGLPLLIVLVAILGASIYNIIIIIGFLGWMGFARIIRSQVLTLKERPFIEAAKAAGSGPMRTMFVHVFPNLVSLTYVNLALSVPAAILTESALEFLGLGDPAAISWGNMFDHARGANSLTAWWWIAPPGIAIAVVMPWTRSSIRSFAGVARSQRSFSESPLPNTEPRIPARRVIGKKAVNEITAASRDKRSAKGNVPTNPGNARTM